MVASRPELIEPMGLTAGRDFNLTVPVAELSCRALVTIRSPARQARSGRPTDRGPE